MVFKYDLQELHVDIDSLSAFIQNIFFSRLYSNIVQHLCIFITFQGFSSEFKFNEIGVNAEYGIIIKFIYSIALNKRSKRN